MGLEINYVIRANHLVSLNHKFNNGPQSYII